MSGTTTNYDTFIASTEYGSKIFSGERSEFGIYKFSDPRRQATYEYHENQYKKMLKLKNAYDKQELLRKMRADMKREYLTRKKQVVRLQKDAAIDFRNAESSLQEHYATEAADHHPYVHAININAPLVSQIQLPNDQVLDLKTFDEHREFTKVYGIHEDLRRDQEESIRQIAEQAQKQAQAQEEEQRWCEADAEAWKKWTKRQYLQCSPYETKRVIEARNDNQENDESDCSEPVEDGNDYCGPFGYYPRGEVPRERQEAGLASIRRCAQAEQQQQQEQQQQEQQQQEEEQVGRYGDGGFCCCGDLECSDCFSYGGENDGALSPDSDYCGEYNWECECREAEEAEEAAKQQWMEKTHNDAYQQACDDYPDVQQLEVVQVTEPKARITASAASSGGISAKKKAAAGAAKARIAKQQRAKKQQQQTKQFVPIQITVNTNRVTGEDTEYASYAMLYQGKAEINLPKKNLQNVSREGKKRDAAKWRRINAAEKQSNARGTRIANIREPRSWHNCGGSDSECNEYN